MEDKQETYNFSAGPSCLPKSVLKKVQEDTLDWEGTGISVMEMSHRSKEFASIMSNTEEGFRKLMEVPDNYKILFLPSGASMQFSGIPMNLLTKNKKANYLAFGTFGKSAINHARRYDTDITEVVEQVDQYLKIPDFSTWKVDPEAKYFHYWDNETLYGIEFNGFPFDKLEGQEIVCDMSSNICSRRVDWSKYGLVYTGLQKNIGPSGVTIIVIREDLIEEPMSITPDMMSYKKYADAPGQWFSTPWCWSIYVAGLNLELMNEKGIDKLEEEASQKCALIYEIIDNKSEYYINNIDKFYRSRLNIVFRVKNDKELENKFIEEAAKVGLVGIRGHKTVGGIRVSIYNAMLMEGVIKMAEFMKEFMVNNP